MENLELYKESTVHFAKSVQIPGKAARGRLRSPAAVWILRNIDKHLIAQGFDDFAGILGGTDAFIIFRKDLFDAVTQAPKYQLFISAAAARATLCIRLTRTILYRMEC